MKEATARKTKPTHVHALAVSKRFGRYKTEDPKPIRKKDQKIDRVLEQLKEAWAKYKHDKDEGVGIGCSKVLLLTWRIKYSSRDVEKFSLALVEFQDEEDFRYKAGIFLSSLINNGKDGDYVIHTRYLDKKIHWLGFMNRKNIVIEGNVGHFLGAFMEGGTIVLNGNCGDDLGHFMAGGSIILNGAFAQPGQIFGGAIYFSGKIIAGREDT